MTNYARTVRFRERHPERRREVDARYREAQRILRERYRPEYDLILAESDDDPKDRARKAFIVLRENHRDEWDAMIGPRQ